MDDFLRTFEKFIKWREQNGKSFQQKIVRGTECETNISVNINSCTCDKCQELFQDKIFNVHMLSSLRWI